MPDTFEYQSNEWSQPQNIEREQQQGVLIEDILSLDLNEEELNISLDAKIAAARSYYKETLQWWSKMEEAENIWLGSQLDEDEMYPWQLPYVDNVIFRDIESIIPIAVSKNAAPQATPAQDTPLSKKLSEDLEKHLEYGFSVKRENMRSKVRKALRHLLLYRIGVIKWLWDPDIGQAGDYHFEVIRPTRLYAFDHTTDKPGELNFIVELVTESAKVTAAKFPSKKTQLYEELGIKPGTMEDDKVFTYQEVHFTHYNNSGQPEEGLLWRYKHLILDKMKDPNWDYQGQEQQMEQEMQQEATGMEMEMAGGMMEGLQQAPEMTKVFRNFLENPEKPYIFLTYLNLGKQLIDDTSLLLQSWPLQRQINKTGMQITEMADKAQGKLAISTAFVSSENAELITDDPKEHIVGDGDVRQGVSQLQGQAPDKSLFDFKNQNSVEIDNLMGTHSTTRGERKEQETLGGRQLLMSGDLGRIEDLVQEAIEPAYNKAYQVATHLMKLRYTEPHYAKLTGKDGQLDFTEFTSDSIEDGIEVTVQVGSSLPIDKLARKEEAIKLVNYFPPDVLYERLDMDNPKEEAIKMVTFQTDPALYQQILLSGKTFTEALPEIQAKAQEEEQAAAGQQADTEGQQKEAGEMDRAAEALKRMKDFAESDKFQELSPEEQQDFIEKMRAFNEQLKQVAGGGQAPQEQQPTQIV